MKRHFVFASTVILALAASGLLMAQSDPFVGTWKLNLAKSQYDPAPPPKSQTRTWESSGKVSVEGVDAAGNPMKYGYTIKSDGKDYPKTRASLNGADTIATKRIAPKTVEATFERNSKQVETTRFAISKDGKLLTITAKGTNPSGQCSNNVIAWDTQEKKPLRNQTQPLALTLRDAILRHLGEGSEVTEQFRKLKHNDQEALIDFLRSL